MKHIGDARKAVLIYLLVSKWNTPSTLDLERFILFTRYKGLSHDVIYSLESSGLMRKYKKVGEAGKQLHIITPAGRAFIEDCIQRNDIPDPGESSLLEALIQRVHERYGRP